MHEFFTIFIHDSIHLLAIKQRSIIVVNPNIPASVLAFELSAATMTLPPSLLQNHKSLEPLFHLLAFQVQQLEAL